MPYFIDIDSSLQGPAPWSATALGAAFAEADPIQGDITGDDGREASSGGLWGAIIGTIAGCLTPNCGGGTGGGGGGTTGGPVGGPGANMVEGMFGDQRFCNEAGVSDWVRKCIDCPVGWCRDVLIDSQTGECEPLTECYQLEEVVVTPPEVSTESGE